MIVNRGESTIIDYHAPFDQGFTECESFVFTFLTYRNVQRFCNGPVHEFAWKLVKWAKFMLVLTNTHMLKNQESSGTEFQTYGKRINLTAKRKTSRQKEYPHGRKNNHDLTAKEIIIQMSSRYRRNFAASLFLFAIRFFCFESFSFCHEVFLFAASLFLLAARWGYSFSREVFLFAARLMLLPWQLWATILRWGKQQAIGEDTERNDLSSL